VLKTARPAVEAVKDAAEELAEEMDCDPETGLGAACLPNHYIGTLQSTDRAMRAIADATPAVAANVAAISGDAAAVSKAASEVVPQMLTTGQQTNSEIKGIAADAHKLADRLTAPRSAVARVGDGLWMMLRAASLFW